MNGLLVLANGLTRGLELSELSAQGTGFLGTEILGQVLLAGICFLHRCTLFMAQDSEHASDSLADVISTESKYQRSQNLLIVHLGDLVGAARGNFLDAKGRELVLEFHELLREFILRLVAKFKSLDVGRL